jgi:hypothetical protein
MCHRSTTQSAFAIVSGVQNESAPRAHSRRIGRLSLLSAVVGVAWLLLPLRLWNLSLNHMVALLSIWGVFVCFGVAGVALPRRWWSKAIASTPFFIAATLYSLLLIGSLVAGGPFIGSNVLDSITLPHSRVVAYCYYGGATSAFSVKIVHEMHVFPGVVLVKDLDDDYDKSTASLKAIGTSTVEATVDGQTRHYAVRRFVYF